VFFPSLLEAGKKQFFM